MCIINECVWLVTQGLSRVSIIRLRARSEQYVENYILEYISAQGEFVGSYASMHCHDVVKICETLQASVLEYSRFLQCLIERHCESLVGQVIYFTIHRNVPFQQLQR